MGNRFADVCKQALLNSGAHPIMSQSFSLSAPLGDLDPERRRVLVTGAAGRIGSFFASKLHQKYDLRLMARDQSEDCSEIQGYGEVVFCELSDLKKLESLLEGIDTVLHLAGDPSPNQTWNSTLQNNIIGTYNTFVAAKAAGCRRVIYASSIHAVSGYPKNVQVKTNEPVNPGDLYGVSKCFGEALGRYMAEQEGLSVIAVRIGGFQPETTAQKADLSLMDAWVSHEDLIQLFERCIDVRQLKWAVFHGLSNNTFNCLDISDARELVGYDPQDNFARENPLLKDLHLDEEIMTHSLTDESRSGLRNEIRESKNEN